MFLKFTRINGLGEEKECVINTDMIIGITEKHNEPVKLYDNEGNVVETRETPKTFEIVLKGGVNTLIKEDTYKELLKTLSLTK